MGCDIHMHTEVKIAGQWHHYGAPHVGRNYELFCLLAGVRGGDDDPTPISQPRGIPDDASTMTRFASDYDGADGHSHSWISAEEIARVDEHAKKAGWTSRHGPDGWWMANEFGFLFGSDWSDFATHPGERPDGIEDIRWVFWFDN